MKNTTLTAGGRELIEMYLRDIKRQLGNFASMKEAGYCSTFIISKTTNNIKSTINDIREVDGYMQMAKDIRVLLDQYKADLEETRRLPELVDALKADINKQYGRVNSIKESYKLPSIEGIYTRLNMIGDTSSLSLGFTLCDLSLKGWISDDEEKMLRSLMDNARRAENHAYCRSICDDDFLYPAITNPCNVEKVDTGYHHLNEGLDCFEPIYKYIIK